ncbi:MAG: NUDIX hydrolase [Actinobacteria bacterium]|nr:NUDIX hydrolase [Actinomycetota bacterium]
MRTRPEVSAGGVVYRRTGGEVEIALAARRNRRGDLAWGLPKGLVEEGETAEVTAVREVREETGLWAEIEAPLGEVSYFYVWEGERVRKTVHVFLLRATGGDLADHDHEMEEVRWFGVREALATASYPSEREVLERALAALGERTG